MSVSRVALDGGASSAQDVPSRAVRAGRGDGAEASFVVNGRFYGQPVTGVQRYAREIVRAMDPLLAIRGRRAALALPRGAAQPMGPSGRIAAEPSRWMSGHAWEQGMLPFCYSAPLLNLCNTGPVLLRKQVVCIHDANVFTQPGSYRRAFRTFYQALHPLLARRAAIVATVSEASAADLALHLGLDRRRIAVLPNGHEHALRWQAKAGAMPRLTSTRPFVLLLGSRARHKNVGLLLRLAPALDALGLDLVVTGGRSAIFADMQAMDQACNLHWLGAVSDSELATLMGRALCLAFPSWTEGFGLPIVEAMARGCPVVASDRASMPEVCGSAALLAAPDAPGAWLDAIARLHGSADLREDLAGRGREQARRFSWSASASGYLDLLESLQ